MCSLWGAEDHNGEEMKAYRRQRVFKAYPVAHSHNCDIVHLCTHADLSQFSVIAYIHNYSNVVLPFRSVSLLLPTGPHQLHVRPDNHCLPSFVEA